VLERLDEYGFGKRRAGAGLIEHRTVGLLAGHGLAESILAHGGASNVCDVSKPRSGRPEILKIRSMLIDTATNTSPASAADAPAVATNKLLHSLTRKRSHTKKYARDRGRRRSARGLTTVAGVAAMLVAPCGSAPAVAPLYVTIGAAATSACFASAVTAAFDHSVRSRRPAAALQ
jgi:hypothetical protein